MLFLLYLLHGASLADLLQSGHAWKRHYCLVDVTLLLLVTGLESIFLLFEHFSFALGKESSNSSCSVFHDFLDETPAWLI